MGPVSDLTARPFYSAKVHPRPSQSPVIDSSVLAFPWSLPTDNRSQPLLYSCPVSFSGPALSAWLHTFARPLSKDTPWQEVICPVLLPVGIPDAPFLVFTALSPPCGECLIQAGGPAGMDTARRWGILRSGSGAVAREEGLQPREINELSVCRTEEDSRIGWSYLLGWSGVSWTIVLEWLRMSELLDLSKEWCSEIRSTLTSLRSSTVSRQLRIKQRTELRFRYFFVSQQVARSISSHVSKP